MRKDVMITVSSFQEYENGEDDTMEFLTEGKLYDKNDKLYVSYEESEVTGLTGTRTTLKIEEEQTTLIRTGLNSSQMLFAKGKRHTGLYPTPYGTLTIATHTSEINNKMSLEGGFLEVHYTIEVDNKVTGFNKLKVNVAVKDEDLGKMIGDFKI